MPSYKELWPDKWLKATHLQDKAPTVTIEQITIEELYNPRSRKSEKKLIIAFWKKHLRLILNKTQATALEDICGTDDYELWIGNQIVLSAGTAPNGMPTIVLSPCADPPPTTPTSASRYQAEIAQSDDTIDSEQAADPLDLQGMQYTANTPA